MLSLINVNKSFNEQGTFEVLKDINMSVNEGEFVCILGPSGCGKTILLYLIAGFLEPTSGRISLNNNPISKPGTDRMMVFQDYVLFPWKTVYGNVLFGLNNKKIEESQKEKMVMHYIELVGLTRFKDWNIHKLSGGMQQRVAIARALIVNPKILLMDEPFSAIDSQHRKLLRMSLEAIWQKRKQTILFVTHSIDEAIQLADKIYVMGARPSKIMGVTKVDLLRPRNRTSKEFLKLSKTMDNLISKEFDKMMLNQSHDESLGELLRGEFL